MTRYAEHFSTRQTPQSQQADSRQVMNSAGGYSFKLDPWKQLERWLILGSEGGTYYVSEQELTRENAKVVQACLTLDGARAVQVIAEVSRSGRAPKNEPAVFALALAAGHQDAHVRQLALSELGTVCRTATHLFQFVQSVRAFRGWGRSLKRAVARWYTDKSERDLCYQIAKYQQRGGMSHRDVLRLAHPDGEHQAVFRYIVAGPNGLDGRTVRAYKELPGRVYPATGELPAYLAAFEELKRADERRTIDLIREHNFTHEMIRSEHKNSAAVWEALLDKMPLGALVRNLGKMTEVGLVKPMASAVSSVAERLANADSIRRARLHPIAILSALRVYAQGHGERGSLSWSPVPQIVDALDAAFYLAFDAIEPTRKRTLLALDVSGSMGAAVAGVPGLTCRDVCAALAMVTARTERSWYCLGFTSTFQDLSISPNQRLADVVRRMSSLPFGRTDCALPMLWASGEQVSVDAFHVYTDNETWFGQVHPHQALRAYREKSGVRDAKLVVVGMTATGFSIADPSDAGMLDVVGCDTSTPALIADFARS